MSAIGLPRNLVIFAVVVPLALCLGYLLSTPLHFNSMAIVGLVLTVLLIPVFLRWHHPFLVFAWNANITIFFLPGKPLLWMFFAAISFGITVLACILEKRLHFQHVPSITWPLLFLLMVVIITAKLTGGIGLRSLGSANVRRQKIRVHSSGSCRLFRAEQPAHCPIPRASLPLRIFTVGCDGCCGESGYLAGPAFYFLYWMFPVDNAIEQAMEDFAYTAVDLRIGRLPGVGVAATAMLYFFQMRYGVRGLLTFRRPWITVLAILLLGSA